MNGQIRSSEIPQEIYVAILNRKGFCFNKSLKIFWNEQEKGWTNSVKKVFITKLGLSVRHYSISYSSPERDKVQSWMLGIRCCNYMHKIDPLIYYANLNEKFLSTKKKDFNNDIEETIESIKIAEE
jgi:hypothetical protein